ncbi:D-alanyl-D-alanine carboxypeptidase [Patescibacteria group bacterium]|nr:D-alanyl-D-alanine carboxypeptidase [Patescibacteria group bacterium]MCL5798164.1 D-alanyl-D-alanine carboxypeptidase [Patescibacteria group bacterium]
MTKLSRKKSPKKNFWRIIYFTLFTLVLFLFPAPNIYFQTVADTGGLYLPQNIKLPPPPAYPVMVGNPIPPVVTAQGVYIVDIPSKVVLYQKNPDEEFLPASTTKIATVLVALDHYRLDDVLKVNTVITDGSVMGLVHDEQITVESLLYGALVESGNDAAYTLAENYPGGVSNFVDMMNKKAQELHLSHTHFANPIGFDDPPNYTTPSDLAKLAMAALHNKTFTKIIGIKNITVSDVTYTYFHSLTNVNQLLGKIQGVAGVKTGYTQNAGEILVSEVKKNGHSVLFVILKSDDRFGETTQLINWIFNNFGWKNIESVVPTGSS